MKKFLVAIIATLYLGASSGASLHLHYCMGKLVGAQMELWQKESNACEECGMPKSKKADGKSCCKDEHKTIQLSKDQKAAASYVHSIQAAPAALPVQYCFQAATRLPDVTRDFPVSHAPPGAGQPPLFLRNCVFLI